MTEDSRSPDAAKLDAVRDHLFDMEDHLNRADEALRAAEGLVDIENPARYKAAINIVVDVLSTQVFNLRKSWEPASELVGIQVHPALADKVETGLARVEQGCGTLKRQVENLES